MQEITELGVQISKVTRLVNESQSAIRLVHYTPPRRTISHWSENALRSFGRWRLYAYTSCMRGSPCTRIMHRCIGLSSMTNLVANLSVGDVYSLNLTSNRIIRRDNQIRKAMSYHVWIEWVKRFIITMVSTYPSFSWTRPNLNSSSTDQLMKSTASISNKMRLRKCTRQGKNSRRLSCNALE